MSIQGLDASKTACNALAIKAVNNMAKTALAVAKEATPVHTGTLLNGYTLDEATSSNPVATIENDVPYAGFVNDGTVKEQGHFMIQKAVSAISPDGSNYT
jgi:hypothetical protein